MVPVDQESVDWLDAPGGPIEAGACGILASELLMVQPVCLQSVEHTEGSEQPAAGQTSHISTVYMQKLQVNLEAKLTRLKGSTPYSEQAMMEHLNVESTMPLQQATLELVVLSNQARVLVLQQYSLLELLLQQQNTPYQHSQLSDSSVEAVHSRDQPSSNDGSWSVSVKLLIDVPCEPSGQVLDFLNLVLLSKSAQSPSQQQETQPTQLRSVNPSSADPASSHLPQQQVQLLASVPLLLLPAVAYQEVQQHLLPAMIQEAQVEAAGDPLQVEHAVWKHMQQLVQDLYAVVLLVRLLANPASEAVASRIAAEAAAAANASGTATGNIFLHTIEEDSLPSGSSQHTFMPAVAADQGAVAMSSEAALDSVAEVMLFPILLPFLAAHGLHNLLQLLLSVLPVDLQHRWEQQQHLLLQAEHAAAEQTGEASKPVEEVYEQGNDDSGPKLEQIAASKAAGSVAAGGSDAVVQEPQQGRTPCAGSAGHQPPQRSATEVRQRRLPSLPERSELAHELEYDIDSKPGVAGDTSVPGAVETQATTAATAGTTPTASWYSPLMQFDSEDERRYLTWKHHSLLYLDQVSAVFGFLYLMALLIRSVSEPTALFHVLYVSLKVLPHIPLMLGFKLHFLRYRELWFWFVIPATLVGFYIFAFVQNIADPVTLLPQKSLSALWKSRGELVINAMVPFIQHMRLRPYIAYIVSDAVMTTWVYAQFYPLWEAAGRWGFASLLSIGLCWGLDLHMRRKFVAAEHRTLA